MRVIETLLGIVDMKRAEGLVLALGEVPALLLSGARLPLTMPALSQDMMEHVLNDLLSADERAALRELGAVEAAYRSSAYGTYAVHARAQNDSLAFTLTRLLPGPAHKVGETSVAAPHPQSPHPQSPHPQPPHPQPPHTRPRKEAPVAEPRTALPIEEPAHPAAAQTARTFDIGPLDAILEEAVVRRASDVIVSSGHAPLLRVDGTLVPCEEAAPITSDGIETYVVSQLGHQRKRIFEDTGSVDFALHHTDALGERVRFRANAFRHDGGLAIALRPIVADIPSLADLHLPASLTQLVEQRTGLLLFTGATGSGKSTTLAALLEHINRTRAVHIVTLEDPVEYIYRPRRSIIHQREVGEHVDGFASGLRAALRENPDVLLVGEMRDPETIRMTLTAAQTGHLVLSTIHSGSAVMAIDRLIDGFPESEKSHVRHELAASLRHIVAQQLVQANGGGRLPAVEILTVTHAIASQIRDGRTHMVATQLETGGDEGMVPMARSLASLVRSGRVARSVALAACEHRDTLERLLEERLGAGPRMGR
ncbi:MAG: PilT/PilU family type 4a pilus ATPase [Myxococcales bacterium]